jgi:rod shape-determining protein MreC
VFKFRKKKLIYLSAVIAFVLFLSFCVPSVSLPLITALKSPAVILNLLMREVNGIIFYHRNFIENKELKKQIGLLSHKLNALEETRMENERLKRLLKLKQGSSFNVTAARVIARSPDSWSSSVVIDKGRHHGIKRGMAVISYSGLVGRVVDALGYSSKVMLISDPSLSISATVQRSRQEGLVSGALGVRLIMRYLPEGSDIKPGDTIITSGLSGSYPKGILIGKVVSLGDEFSGISRYAIIKPEANLSNIEEVLIVVQ